VAIAPIEVSYLFPVLDRKLEELLRSLSQEDWDRPATPKWRVKDVAGHLLDGNLRRLSMARDGYRGEPFSGSSEKELVDFLNGLNADWVKAMRRLSPQVLIEFLRETNRDVAAYFQSLDPHGEATFPVSWAGESKSENWFDVAREYTEKWHHQQQIREAVGKGVEAIMTREIYHPVLETFLRAVPHGYREVQASEKALVGICITGEAGGDWYLVRENDRWRLSADGTGEASAEVTIPQSIAWKLFTKGLTQATLGTQVAVRGDPALATPMLKVTAIVG
jgi:uncharacterized protein (TIGR03083 family)